MRSHYSKQARFILIVFLSILSAQLKLNAQACTPPNITGTVPGARCGIGTTTLGVSGDPGATFKWYAAASGGTSVGTGSVFTTPTLTSTTNFYVTASSPGATVAATQTLGAGASADDFIPYNFTNGIYGGLKAQYLFRASELTAAGISAGNITSLKFDLTTAGSILNGFAVQMGTTALNAFASANIQGGLTTVYPSASFTPVVGANTLNFSTPFNWDGTSNIIISFSWSNSNSSNTSSTIRYDAISYNASQMYLKDFETAANLFAFTGSTGTGSNEFRVSQDRPAFALVASSICEGPRTPVTAVVNTPPALALTTATQVCQNVIKPLTITSNVADYTSYIWSPATNLYTDMSATTPYTGGSATTLYYKTTANSNLVYTVTATNSVNGCNNLATTTITTNVPAINASLSQTVVCSGSPVNLNATTNVTTTGTVAIGNGTSTTDGSAFEPTPFANDNGNYRIQTIYTAAELFAAGLRAGNITSIAYRITTIGGSATNANYTVKCGTTTATTFTDFVPSTGFTTVFPATTFTHAVGLNTINFITPYLWDGVSNIIIDVSHDGIAAGISAEAYYTQTAGNTVVFAMNGNTTNSGNTDNMRLNIIFTGQMDGQGAGAFAWQWNPGAINSHTAVVNPVNTGTNSATSSYTVTGTDPVTTCSNTAVVSVLVNPMPALPIASNSSQCGLGIPTASVSGATTYKWYATPTSTTALQSGTSTNFTTAINATTTWYVSSYNANCENTRTAVTTTVIPANTINAVSSSTALCPGQSFSLTASQTGTATAYQFTWTATPATGSGMATSVAGATVSVAPTIPGTYTYIVTGVSGACTATAAVNVTVNALPVINASTSPSVICSGSAVTLNATTNSVSAGTVAMGAGTNLTGSTEELTAFCNRRSTYRMQILYTAAELSAAGLYAGNISAISFSISAVGSAATTSNYTVKCGTTTATAFTGYLPSGSFATVYTAPTQPHAIGLNTITFSTPYFWDGSSNLVIECSHSGINSSNNARTYYTTTTGNTVVYNYNGATTGLLSNNRLNILFNGQTIAQTAGNMAWQWNPGAINSHTAIVNPVNTGTNSATSSYTVTGTDPVTTCSNTAVVSVSVNPMPALPIASNSSQCGLGIPTASVSGATTYKWYATPTSTTALQSGTSTNFTTAINATTTWYVSSYNANCENTRTAVTTTVIPADAINAISSSTAICPGQSFSLTASQTGTGASYQYTWTAVSAAGSGLTMPVAGTTVSVTPTASGTYTYLVTGVGGACTATAVVNVTAKALPVINASISPSVICSGSTVTLNATTTGVGAGTVAMGAGTNLTGSTEELTAFCNRRSTYRMQILYTAAELSAAGLYAGNISAISFSISTVGDAATTSNYTVKCGTTTATAFTGYLPSGSFATVYTAPTQSHAIGLNTITFSTPYFWDGSSNLVIECSHGGIDNSSNARTYYTTTTGNTVVYNYNGATTGLLSNKRFNILFNGQTIAQTAGNMAWQWNPGAINSNTAIVTPTTGATPSTVIYTVTAIDAATSCSNTAAVSVTVNPALTVSVTASTPTLCSGSSATLTANGAATYSWMPAGGSNATITVTPASTTVYTITGSSLGCNSTKTISIGVTPSPTLAASASSLVICAGATVNLTANGASNYTWTPSGVTTASLSVTPALTSTYTVKGESAGGCSQTKTLTVTVNTVPTLTITTSPSVALCSAGASATLTATGTSTAYVWSNGSTMALSMVAPSTTTTYTVTGQNSCGTSTAVTTVSVATTPTIAATSPSSVICVNNSVVLTANATPGVSYAWNTGATTPTISVSPTITTTYTVTGANACGTATAVIVQPVSTCIGIEEMNHAAEISIYPNPAQEYINVSIPSHMASFVTRVEVTDALGKLVMKQTLTADHTTLNLSQLEEGIYFFTVISHDRIVKTSKVVK